MEYTNRLREMYITENGLGILKMGKDITSGQKMAMNTGDIGAMTCSREKEYPRRAEYYTEMITIKESELQGVKYSEAFDFHYSV
jgi:hypothetical protein